mgnify:CR=1 FL=1
MDFSLWTPLISALLAAAIAVKVTLRNRKRRAHWLFVMFAGNVAVWYLATFIEAQTGNTSVLGRITALMAILLPQTGVRFLRAFHKAQELSALALASEQFKDAPLAYVFGTGYEEVDRQVKSAGRVRNKTAVERMLQLGISQESTRLEARMNLLATTATVTPFIGLFGTVWGIIQAFNALS